MRSIIGHKLIFSPPPAGGWNVTNIGALLDEQQKGRARFNYRKSLLSCFGRDGLGNKLPALETLKGTLGFLRMKSFRKKQTIGS